jgi:hypothetical protein
MASIMTIDESNGSKMNIIVNDKDRWKAFQISYLESLLSIRLITIFIFKAGKLAGIARSNGYRNPCGAGDARDRPPRRGRA